MNPTSAFVAFLFTLAVSNPTFSYKTHGNVANYFENEEDFKSFFQFQSGDVIAEIGAGKGYNLKGFSWAVNEGTFYAQDIDSTALSKKNFEQTVHLCQKAKPTAAQTFHRCIGTEKQTYLPDNAFDKIILVSTFHEFSFMDAMINDIYKKLKPNGRLYILEAQCTAPGHKNYTFAETIDILSKYPFELLKKEEKNLHESTGMYRLIFKKI